MSSWLSNEKTVTDEHMTKLVPAFLVESAKEFEQKLRLVEGHVDLIQVDVLDGSLFPNTVWYDAERVGALKTNVKMELHLMVENPIPIVEAWKEHVPTFTLAIVHAEMHRPLGAVVDHIKNKLGLKVGVAINPETPLHQIEETLHEIDQLTIMGVHPGESGQAFLGETILEKIRNARSHSPDLLIEMDGGATEELIDPLIQAGVNQICAASLIFKTNDPIKTLQSIKKRL
jgi:ribulose-phosphate 3-epimerase